MNGSLPLLWISKSTALEQSRKAPGFDIIHAPLLHVERIKPSPAAPAKNDILVFSSTNALDAFCAVNISRHSVVYTVGAATKACALAHRFSEVRSADGDIEALYKLITAREDPKTSQIYYACAAQVSGDLTGRLMDEGYAVIRADFYRTTAVKEIPRSVHMALEAAREIYVFLYSQKGAQAFVSLDLPFGEIKTVSISSAVDEKLETCPLKARTVAKHPSHAALLDCASYV